MKKVFLTIENELLREHLSNEFKVLNTKNSVNNDLIILQTNDIKTVYQHLNNIKELRNTTLIYLSTSKLIKKNFPCNSCGARQNFNEECIVNIEDSNTWDIYTCECLIKDYCKLNEIKSAIFRLGCVVGYPSDKGDGFLTKAMDCFIKKEIFSVYGYDGKQVRDQLHYKDLFNAIIKFYMSDKNKYGELYMIGGGLGNSITPKKLVEKLKEKDSSFTWKYEDKVLDNRPYYVSNNMKALTDFGWMPKIGLDEIINMYLSDVKSLGPNQ